MDKEELEQYVVDVEGAPLGGQSHDLHPLDEYGPALPDDSNWS